MGEISALSAVVTAGVFIACISVLLQLAESVELLMQMQLLGELM